MGYALFAQRKVSLVSQINDLQYQLLEISQQRHDLVKYEGVIADGYISPDEIIQNFSIAPMFSGMQQTFDEIGNARSNDIDATIEAKYAAYYDENLNPRNGLTEEEIEAQRVQDRLYAKAQLCQDYVQKVHQKEIAVQESELDMKQKRIETRLTALQQELQSVEQAEGQAIQNATPKYSGLG